MKLLVTGCGRGGTNLGIELVRSYNYFNVTSQVEDRTFFKRDVLPERYATKLATENRDFNEENISSIMDRNADLHVIFMVRNPVDVCLSKIYRGRPMSQGGDSSVNQTAPDGTVIGACNAIKKMYKIFNFLSSEYPNRVFLLKMESLIEHKERSICEVSEFLGLKSELASPTFYKNNRNNYQKNRYGNNLVKNVDLYKDLENNYDGFFKSKSSEVEKIKLILSPISNFFRY